MKQVYETGDQVVLIENWTWQDRHDYGAVRYSRPMTGMVGTVRSVSKNYVVVDFSEATGNEDLTTLCTDFRVIRLVPEITDEDVEDAIKSILNPNV